MNVIKSHLKNVNVKAGISYIFGNFFDKAIVFLTIPVFTRLMSASEFGVFNTYLSCVTILAVLHGLSSGSSIRNASIDYKDSINQYIGSMFFVSLAAAAVAGVLFVAICVVAFDRMYLILTLSCILHSFMVYVISVINNKYMMFVNYKAKMLLTVIPNLFIILASVAFLLVMKNDRYYGRIYPYLIILSAVGCYYLFRYISVLDFSKIREHWRYAVPISVPMIFHGLSMNVLAVSDRIMISAFRTASETGIYSLVYSFSMIALTFMISMESVWIPWFTRKMEEKNKAEINKKVYLYIDLALIVTIVLLLFGPEILTLMVPKEYWNGKYLIPPILMASFVVFLYSILVDAEYYYRNNGIIAKCTLVAAAVNIILNVIFIPFFGAVAAAYSTLIAYTVSFLMHYFAVLKIDSELFSMKTFAQPAVLMAFSCIILYTYMDSFFLRLVLIFTLSFIYYLVVVRRRKK